MKDFDQRLYSKFAINTQVLIQLGNNINKIREKKKISKEDVCYRTNSSKASLTRIESGNNKKINILDCEKIATALEVPIWKLFKF